jgi:hypothetical protein
MTLPKKVKIGYATVSIDFIDDIELKRLNGAEENDRLYGCFVSRDNAIYLLWDLEPLQLADVFLHECLHAHAHIHGIRFKENTDALSEETGINTSSSATVTLWSRNHAAKKWWDSLFK